MAEAEAVPVTFRYARAKKRQIEEERTRAASTSDLGATTQVGHNVIAMPLLRTKRPSWKEVAEELQEEREDNQRLEQEIDRLQQLTLRKAAAEFEARKARELARE